MWSYNPDGVVTKPPNKDYYRLLLGDIIKDDPILNDSQIEKIMELEKNDLNRTMVLLAETAINIYSAKVAGEITSYSLGPATERREGKATRLANLKQVYEKYRSLVSSAYGFGVY